MDPAEAFTFEDVVLERGGQRILDGVSDHIHWAQTTAIVGASGAGKSTFLRLLNRFEDPTEGTILLDGRALDTYDVHALRRRVGLVAQRTTMLTETIGQELRVAKPELTDDQANALRPPSALRVLRSRAPPSFVRSVCWNDPLSQRLPMAKIGAGRQIEGGISQILRKSARLLVLGRRRRYEMARRIARQGERQCRSRNKNTFGRTGSWFRGPTQRSMS